MPLNARLHPLVAMAVVLTTALASPARAALEACDGSWSVAPAPTVPTGAFLRDLAVLSDGDAWAVGGTAENQAVISHRQDGKWNSEVVRGMRLVGVAARPGTAWAVGSQGDRGQPLVLLNTGRGWTSMTPPVPAIVGWATLTAVAMTTASNVWISGQGLSSRGFRGFALHFDGRRWRSFVLPPDSRPLAVDTLGPSDTWIAGARLTPEEGNPASWHWDGRTWTQEVLTIFGTQYGTFRSVSALPDGTTWAAGSWDLGNCCNNRGIVGRHTARGWDDLSGQLGQQDAYLHDVLVGRNSARPTVLGDSFIGDSGGGRGVLVLATRIGRSWMHQDIRGLVQPPAGGASAALFAADADGRGHSWAVGSSGGRTLVVHRC